MDKFLSLVKGKKTYYVGLAGSIIALLIAFNIIQLTMQQIYAVALVLASLFGITFRDALTSITIPPVSSEEDKTK